MTNGKVRGPTLDLNMSVQEMRAKLAAKKKEKMDAKNAKIDLRKKHDIIEMLWGHLEYVLPALAAAEETIRLKKQLYGWTSTVAQLSLCFICQKCN